MQCTGVSTSPSPRPDAHYAGRSHERRVQLIPLGTTTGGAHLHIAPDLRGRYRVDLAAPRMVVPNPDFVPPCDGLLRQSPKSCRTGYSPQYSLMSFRSAAVLVKPRAAAALLRPP